MNLGKFEKILFYFLIFLLPSQLAYHFWPSYAFVFGVRVDYLAPTVYLTDLLLIILIAINCTKVKTVYIFGILAIAFINIFISISPWASLWRWLKVFEFIFFAKYIYDNFKLIKNETFSVVVSLSLILISSLGILQFNSESTLGGIFYLIGERVFNLNTPGAALQTLFGQEYLRAYSSFSHPNSLAGFLLIGIIYLLSLNKKSVLINTALVLSSLCFVLTFSLSAFLAALLTLVFYIISKTNKDLLKRLFKSLAVCLVVFSFILPFIPIKNTYPQEIAERLEQATLAKELIIKNPFFGTGLNTFTILNINLQPVHNIFLLVTVEAGLVGLLLLLILIYRIYSGRFSLFVLPVLIISVFDHYFLTLQQNFFLLSILFGAVLNNKKKLESKNKRA